MKKILILSNSPLNRDPRIQRQIRSLESDYCIIACGINDPENSNVSFVPIGDAANTFWHQATRFPLLLSGKPERYYWAQPWVRVTMNRLKQECFDLVFANDYDCLPLAFRIADGKPLLFDAHEYSPGQRLHRFPFLRWLIRRYRLHLCRTYMPKCDAVMTVAASIADQYRRDTGVSPEIVMNCPRAYKIQVSPVHGDCIRLIHHGAAIPGRRLEILIETMHLLDNRFRLTFMLTGSCRYIASLRAKCRRDPRIDFRDPVALEKIVPTISEYDVGVHMLSPKCLNDRWALPNKFFEFIQARLAVAVGPSPEMAAITSIHDLGVVSKQFTAKSLADALNHLTSEDVRRFKQNSNDAAASFSSEKSEHQIRSLVKNILC